MSNMPKFNNILLFVKNPFILKEAILGKYRRRYVLEYNLKVDYSDCLGDLDTINEQIKNMLISDSPCMIGRYGSVEFECMLNFMKGRHPFSCLRSFFPFWIKNSVTESMNNNAGFFSENYKDYCKFADLLYDSAKEVDLLGSWLVEEDLFIPDMHYTKCNLRYLEPFFSKKPWTAALKDKKVLVVHPYAETIYKQYQKRQKLFDNADFLPEFRSLSVVKAVQTVAGEKSHFSTWFEALKYMEDCVDREDYDIAIIGCGAYGMPLAAHVKKMGKKAFHLGGVTQILFGIKGKRWETVSGEAYKKLLDNPNWVRPSEAETPNAASKVEDGCYW